MKPMQPMPLPFGASVTQVWGGTFFDSPKASSMGMFTIKLAREINLPCSFDLPTADFATPDPTLARQAVRSAIDAMGRGETVFAGCHGGIGRTGLFLALLAKTAGEAKPIEYVRSAYDVRAVETEEQGRFVAAFDVADLRLAFADAVLLAAAAKPPSLARRARGLF